MENKQIITLENCDIDFKKQKVEELSAIVINKLEEYNKNKLSESYCNAIKIMAYDILFYTNKEKILVVPMPTGSGKSTITELAMAYMYNDEYFKKYTGTIILKYTQEDCNGTANNINTFAGKEIAYSYHSGNFKDEKSNMIEDDILITYPILVMTHQGYKQFVLREKAIEEESKETQETTKPKKRRPKKTKGKTMQDVMEWTDKRIDNLTVNYNTFIRDRLIIDEEISNVEPVAITMNTINILENCIMNLGNNELYNDFQTFINNIKSKFIKSYSKKANELYFVYFDDIKKPNGLDEAIYDSRDYKAKESYIHILNLLAHGGYVRYSENVEYKSITTYRYINIYNPLFKKIQLDATASVNALYKTNENYTVQTISDFKTYKNTYLHIYDKITGSRASMKENFEHGLLEACIKDIESKLLEGEKALIVFNNQELQYNFYEMIENTPLMKRVWLTHYGLTTGSNQWSNYDKLFIIGISVLPDPIYPIFYFCNSKDNDFNMYDTTMIPKKGSRVYTEQKFEDVRKTLVASSIIQALNRIKIRKYINGDTAEAHIYLINSDKDIDNIIAVGMNGVNIQYDWNLDYNPPKKNKGEKVDSVSDNAQKIINALTFIIENPNDEDLQEYKDKKEITDKGVTKKLLREELGFTNRPTFNKALESPLFLQFCSDYNIDMSNKNDKTIKLPIKI